MSSIARMSSSVARLALAISVGMPVAARVGAQTTVAADGSAVGQTRFELQRSLLEVDEQRRRLEASLEPVDSVLRVLAYDSTRIASFTKSPLVNRDISRVEAIAQELRLTPDAPDVVARLIDAVSLATRDFTENETSLGSRVLSSAAAQDILARSPNAAVVAIPGDMPPRDTPLWEKLRRSDYGRQQIGRITYQDVATFRAAMSDSGFEAYRGAMTAAFSRRMAEIRQSRDAGRTEVARMRRHAADLAHRIGSQEENRSETHAIYVGLPVFGVVVITLMFAPRIFRSAELQHWMYSSGVWLELTTLVVIVAGMLVLALAGKITEVIIGTLFGAVLGYAVGRTTGKKVDATIAVPAPQPSSVSTTNVPVVVSGRRAQA
jgi:hypothetical protein